MSDLCLILHFDPLSNDGTCLHVLDLPILCHLLLRLHFQDVLQQALPRKRNPRIKFPMKIVVSAEQIVRFLHRRRILQRFLSFMLITG